MEPYIVGLGIIGLWIIGVVTAGVFIRWRCRI